jgi:hypothetical protein
LKSFSISAPPFSIIASPLSIRAPPFTIIASPLSIRAPPFTIIASPLSIITPQFTIIASPLSIRAPPFIKTALINHHFTIIIMKYPKNYRGQSNKSIKIKQLITFLKGVIE